MRRAVEQVPQTVGGGTAPVESVVVSGFRSSLEQSLDMKRQAVDSSDSILAEDIAKFPDLNVSESLQRIPGITLARDQGEGRQISVRGLNSTFTRVRINGMEALATTGSEDVSGGANRGRSFDFNVFASELFSQLTVHKTPSAEVEEGSLGATVDLHTAHPFDKPGFTMVASAQGGYNDLSGGFNPRFAALVSDTFMGGKLGVLVSGAYQIQNGLEVGSSTVRWQNDNTAQSVNHASPLTAGCVTNVPGATSQCAPGQRFRLCRLQSARRPDGHRREPGLHGGLGHRAQPPDGGLDRQRRRLCRRHAAQQLRRGERSLPSALPAL